MRSFRQFAFVNSKLSGDGWTGVEKGELPKASHNFFDLCFWAKSGFWKNERKFIIKYMSNMILFNASYLGVRTVAPVRMQPQCWRVIMHPVKATPYPSYRQQFRYICMRRAESSRLRCIARLLAIKLRTGIARGQRHWHCPQIVPLTLSADCDTDTVGILWHWHCPLIVTLTL